MSAKPFCLMLLILVSCSGHGRRGSGGAESAGAESGGTVNWPGIPDSVAPKLLGTWSGHRSKGLVTVVINYISGNTVSGYELHKGLRRNLNGQVEQKDGKFSFVLKDPGTSPFDGTFFFSLDTSKMKIAGQWMPGDSSKAHAGQLDLACVGASMLEDNDDSWEGDLGTLVFHADGTCQLQYYPSEDPNSQQIIVNGNYEQKVDTFFIEWQYNKRVPVLRMKLVHYPYIESTDSTESVPPSLKGNGVKFEKNMAG